MLGARDSLAVGVALFSMFFGAGNLILAPLMGVEAGVETPAALLGFCISAVGMPVLTVAAVALSGSARELIGRVGARFSEIFCALVYLAIGPALAIPRTASTAFSMIEPLLPAGCPAAVARLAFSIAFFAVAFALALHPNKLVTIMGRVSGPALLALLVLVVGASIIAPPGTPGAADQAYQLPIVDGFLTGYQTMDVLAALCFGLVIALNVRDLGVKEPASVARQVARSGVIAGVLMLLVYAGFAYVGATMGARGGFENGADVISAAATFHYGQAGTVLVAAIFLLACLNVCVGLTSSISTYFHDSYPRLGYRACAAAMAAASCALSNAGLTAIIHYSVPLLSCLYPPAIVLVAMGLARGSAERHPLAWRVAVGACCVAAVGCVASDALPGGVPVIAALPLAGIGLGWVLPSIIGWVAGYLVERARARKGCSCSSCRR